MKHRYFPGGSQVPRNSILRHFFLYLLQLTLPNDFLDNLLALADVDDLEVLESTLPPWCEWWEYLLRAKTSANLDRVGLELEFDF